MKNAHLRGLEQIALLRHRIDYIYDCQEEGDELGDLHRRACSISSMHYRVHRCAQLQGTWHIRMATWSIRFSSTGVCMRSCVKSAPAHGVLSTQTSDPPNQSNVATEYIARDSMQQVATRVICNICHSQHTVGRPRTQVTRYKRAQLRAAEVNSICTLSKRRHRYLLT